MERLLVAFEGPGSTVLEGDPALVHEQAWDRFLDHLRGLGLGLVADLDPVATVGDIEVYEAVAL